jgi:hypothetical protein
LREFPEVYIHPSSDGRLTPSALLRSEGTVHFNVEREDFDHETIIFHIATKDFWFNLGFKDGYLFMQRNEFILKVEPSFLENLPGNKVVLASWTMNWLNFLLGPVGFQGPSIFEKLEIEPRPVPLSLFHWARQQSLIPVEQFDSENHFLSRVHQSVDLLQTKVDEMANPNVFWDFQYQGKKIVNRSPKRETDLHPIIQSLLSDQMFLSSIEVSTEYQTGVGNLDFMFMGSVKNKGVAKICAEFKNAHAKDLLHGLEYQLPAYMKNKNVEHGTYCILDFRGEWFDQPNVDKGLLSAELGRARTRANLPPIPLIKIHFLKLGKNKSASRSKRSKEAES